MIFVSLDKNDVVTATSKREFTHLSKNHRVLQIPDTLAGNIVGRRIGPVKDRLRVAVICNWDQNCGISTYSKYLVQSLRPYCDDLHIFSEHNPGGDRELPGVTYCWNRGESMATAIEKVMAWKPDFVLVQHEFGLFPKATHLLHMLQLLDRVPHAITLHSVYEHLDKSICTAAMKNIIVHTNVAKGVLRGLGNSSAIHIVPHGCVQFSAAERQEHWNIFQTPYAIIQFGFGFKYKGVDRAISAVKKLKDSQPEKYKDIFYTYLCSENQHTKGIHSDYYDFLVDQAKANGVAENVAIIKKYHSDQEINNYLRTAKLAIFPYLNNTNNVVYGASGAIRIAMANGIPVLASENHLFDELPVPRPNSDDELAAAINMVFSSAQHRQQLIDQQDDYVRNNTWSSVAARYCETAQLIRSELLHLVS